MNKYFLDLYSTRSIEKIWRERQLMDILTEEKLLLLLTHYCTEYFMHKCKNAKILIYFSQWVNYGYHL